MSSIVADGPTWIVTIADTVTVSTKPLAVARSIVGKNRASLVIPFDDPRQSMMLRIPTSVTDCWW